MKNLFTTSAILAAVSAGNAVNAQGMGDFYVSVFGGLSIGELTADYSYGGGSLELSLESDTGYILGVAVGTTVAPNIRAEAEVSYASYTIGTISYDVDFGGGSYSGSYDADDDTVVTTTYLLANVWYDIPGAAGSGITPYVGGGLGVVFATAEVDEEEIIDPTNGIAYQAGVGVQVPVGTGMIDAGYRFKGFTGADIESDGSSLSGDGSGYSNNFQVGYVLKF